MQDFSTPILQCLDINEVARVLAEIQEGICGNHVGSQSLAHIVIKRGYYWPTILRNAMEYVKKIRQVPAICPDSSIPAREANIHSQSMTFRQM